MARHLPIVLEQGLASVRLHRARAAEGILMRVGMDEVTCRKGCAHCCHYPVRISIFEGIILYREIQKANLWNSALKHALEEHSKQTFEVASEIWLLASIPCPLLSDGQCTVYDARPFFCKMTISIRDPDLCRAAQFNAATFVPHPEESAAFNQVLHSAARGAHSRVLGKVLPISTSVLLGRHIVDGSGDFDDLDRSVLSEIGRTIH